MTPAERLHQALVDALIQGRPHALDEPVTVAEIYQDLIPYRSVRSDLGFALNADYEHAMMQLLAGQQNLARIEPGEVREQLRLEIESANPDVGLYHEFADCAVFVTIPDRRYEPAQPGIETVAPPPPPLQNPLAALEQRTELPFELPSSEPPPIARVTAPNAQASTGEGGHENTHPAPEQSAATRNSTSPAATGLMATPIVRCVACDESLPVDRNARFCPFCGEDQTQRSCSGCGEPLERSWRFCIRCGAAAQPIVR